MFFSIICYVWSYVSNLLLQGSGSASSGLGQEEGKQTKYPHLNQGSSLSRLSADHPTEQQFGFVNMVFHKSPKTRYFGSA